MKRIISILSAFFMTATVFSGFIGVSAESDINNVSLKEEFCFEMGIFSDEDYDKDKKLTRGEFTEVIANLCNLETIKVDESQWADLMYGDNSAVDKNVIFDDVDSVHPDFPTIKAVVDAGFMRGISENLFGPELYITNVQVYKVLLDMIGYKKQAEMLGGYPAGYMAICSEQGIDKDVKADSNGYLTYEEIAKVIYNMLDVGVMEFDYSSDASFTYQENEDETFMNYVMGIKSVTGFLTDNGYTAIDGESEVSPDYILVGDVKAKISENNSYMRDYIGQYVELYYSFDEKDEDSNEAVYMMPKKNNNEVIVFDADDFIGYTGNSIRYYNENGREKNIALSNMQYMIYNNEAKAEFTENTFKFNDGTVTVIPESINGNTVIVIESIVYAFVNTTNTAERVIYNKISNYDTITELEDYENVTIIDENDDAVAFGDIKASMVLEIVKNSKDIKIKVCTGILNNYNVTYVGENDDGKTVMSNGEENYIVSKQYSNLEDGIKFKIGKVYTLYLNSKKEIVWADTKTTSYKVGYLIKASLDDSGENVIVKICSMDAAVSNYTCDEKVKINDTEGKEQRGLTPESVVSLINKNEVIRFKTNDKGLITYIELPLNEVPETNDRLHKIVDTSKETGKYVYSWGGGGFGGSLSYLSNVNVLKIPADLSDAKKFVKTTPLGAFEGNNNTRRFVAYSTLKNDFIAEYVIALPKTNEIDVLKDERDFFAVKTVNDVLNEDGEIIKEMQGMMVYGTKSSVAIKNVTMYCASDELETVNQMPDLYHSKDASGKENKYEIKAGDIIRLTYDEYNYIQLAELVFRPSLTNPASPNGVKGALAGSIGYYDPNNAYSNPVVIDNNGNLVKNSGKNITGVDFRLALSFVNAKHENVFQVTTQDLSVSAYDPKQNYNPNTNPSGRHIMDAMQISSISSLICIEYNNGKVSDIRAATASDIRSYEEVGKDCSRLLQNWYWGAGLHGFIINGL